MINFTAIGQQKNYTTFKATQGQQFGKTVVSLQCSMIEILKFIEIDNSVQREIIDQHVAEIQKYIQFGMDGNLIFFPPFVFSARGQGKFIENTMEFQLKTEDKLVLLDGQHRIKAFEHLIKIMESRNNSEDIEKLSYVKNFPISLQIYIDLDIKQEKQLFTDINTKASTVSNTILLMYKDNILANKLVKEIIYNHPTIDSEEFEVRGRSTQTKLMTAATMYTAILILNEGRIITELQLDKVTLSNFEVYKKNSMEFLKFLVKYAPHDATNRKKYIILNPKVICGIAHFIYLVLKENPNRDMEYFFKEVIYQVDWTHDNVEFKNYNVPFAKSTKRYNFSNGVRSIKGITNYLLDLSKKRVWN